jgi:hypothetical protein
MLQRRVASWKELIALVMILNAKDSQLVPMSASEVEEYLVENDSFYNLHHKCRYWKVSWLIHFWNRFLSQGTHITTQA